MYIDESGGLYIARRVREAQKKNQKSKHDLKTN